jgi:hypothetical protein
MPQNSQHPFYQRYAPKWLRAEDAYAGEDEVKAKGIKYLPMPSGMSASSYAAYKLRADWFAAVDRTIEGLTGLVLRREPQIVGASDELQRQVNTQRATMITLIQQRLLTGQLGVWLDIIGENVLANALEVRWTAYPGLSIVNWQRDDAGTLTRVILLESADVRDPGDPYIVKEERHYRELVLTDEGYASILWRENAARQFELVEPPRFPERLGKRLPFIPFAMLTMGDKPPLIGLVDKAYDYYRVSADYQHDLHFTSMQTPIMVGWDRDDFPRGEVALGPDVLMSRNPDAKAFMLSPSPAGLEAKRLKLQDALIQMSTLGSRILEPPRRSVEATETVQIRQSGEQTALAVAINQIDMLCTHALQWHAWMIGETNDPNDAKYLYTFNKDYFVGGITSSELQALVAAWQGGALTQEGLHFNLVQGEALPADELDFTTYQQRLAIQAQAAGI